MIYSHGNGCDLGQMSDAVDAYASYFVVSLVYHRSRITDSFSFEKMNVLAIEYPGYGPCGGAPSESGCNENMLAAYHFVTTELVLLRIPP